ncbi:hypothetical protein BH23GEM9_BH23GEM9_17270 [soil metagenome]
MIGPALVRATLLCAAATVLAACATTGGPAPVATTRVEPMPHLVAPVVYTPHRVYDVTAGSFIDFETLAARAATADVVFFGEQHGHAPTHRMQLALLEALARRGNATLSMEMFERDVAHLVSGYVAGSVDHGTFLTGSRPWPRYFPDYHPLVEAARNNGWMVIAANVPRSLANQVAREGLATLDALPAQARAHVAVQIECPEDDYRTRFIAEMSRHPGSAADSPEAEAARNQRYYESQCVKDETMAESIVAAVARGAARPVLHVTGAFHTDHGDGIPARTLRRDGGLQMLSITTVPVADLDALDPAPHAGRADYLLFTLAEPRTGG